MSRFESGCRRLRRCTQTGEGICLESRQAGKPAKGSAPKADRPGNRREGSKSSLRSGRCWTKLHWSFSTPSSPLCSRSPSGRGNRFKPGQGRVQSLRSAPVGAKRSSTGASAPLHLRYAPVAHPEEASGLSPVKGGFSLRSAPVGAKHASTGHIAPLREYMPLYQNGIWIRLRTGGLRVQIPHGGLPQRKTGPVQTRFSEGSNPLSFIYNQQERGN